MRRWSLSSWSLSDCGIWGKRPGEMEAFFFKLWDFLMIDFFQWSLICGAVWVSDTILTVQWVGTICGNMFTSQLSDWYVSLRFASNNPYGFWKYFEFPGTVEGDPCLLLVFRWPSEQYSQQSRPIPMCTCLHDLFAEQDILVNWSWKHYTVAIAIWSYSGWLRGVLEFILMFGWQHV